LRLFSFGGYGLALAALALVVFSAIECPPFDSLFYKMQLFLKFLKITKGRIVVKLL